MHHTITRYKKKLTAISEYSFIILTFLIIYFRNLVSNIMLLDYTPLTNFSFNNLSLLINYNLSIILITINKVISYVTYTELQFQSIVLLGTIVSYTFTRFLIKNNSSLRILFSIIFFFNPFVYSRIMVGQLGVLITYLMLPICIYYTIEFFNKFEKKSIIKLAIVFTIAGSFSLQFLVIDLLIFLISTFWFYFYKNTYNLKKYLSYIALFTILLILLNSFWLQGFFQSSSTINSIDQSHEKFFSPKLSQDVPAIIKVAGMWGFWRENGYITSYNLLPLWLWYTLTFMFIILMLIGYYTTNKEKISKLFYSLWWVGLILAVGTSHPYTKPIFDFLFNYFPFFNGFRDSHKFVALIALAYAYLCPIGIIWIKNKIKEFTKNLKLKTALNYGIPLLFITLIILYTLPLVGLWNQIKSVEYPTDYENTNKFLKEQNITGYIIYLPWQMYLTYNWTIGTSSDGRISNPINNLIEPLIITGPDTWSSSTDLQKNVTTCLDNKSTACLENSSVQFILKDKCTFYQDNYPWINKTLVHEDTCLQVYKINNKDTIENIHFPLRFILGTISSLLTVIILVVYFVINKIKEKQQIV